jgi:hypothetical protein
MADDAQAPAPSALQPAETHPVVLFDGVCNLCQGSVQFLLKRDKLGACALRRCSRSLREPSSRRAA